MIDNDNISRKAAIAAIKSVPSGNWSSKRYIDEIKNIPAADVRPVVLCRECKYAPSGTDGEAKLRMVSYETTRRNKEHTVEARQDSAMVG